MRRLSLFAIIALQTILIKGFIPRSLRRSSVGRLGAAPTSPVLGSRDDGAPASLTDEPDMIAYASAYQTMYREVPCTTCATAPGTSLPPDLRGTYYRNGPVMFTAGSLPPPKTSIIQPKQPVVPDGQDPVRIVLHPFDADGAVLAVTFHGGDTGRNNVTARFRYVRTVGFTNERRKGQRLYTGMDSTRKLVVVAQSQGKDDTRLANDFPLPLYRHHFLPGLNKLRKNTSNTSVLYWANKLITLWEGGLPYKLDAVSCSTIGRSQLGGVLKNENIPLGGRFKYDSNTQRMILYSNVLPTTTSPFDLMKQSGIGGIGTSNSIITLYEFDHSFRLVHQQQSPLTVENFGLITDFGITKDYYIVIEPPLKVKNKVSFAMNKDPGSSLVMQDQGSSYVHVIRREGAHQGDQISCILQSDGISDANIHICNAYQEKTSPDIQTITLDLIRCDARNIQSSPIQSSWPWAKTLQEYSSSTSKKSLWRYTIQLKETATSAEPKISILRECLCDFQLSFGIVNPSVSGQKNSYLYANVARLGNSGVCPPQGIIKFDCNKKQIIGTWMPLKHEFCGEPMFAPKSGKSLDGALKSQSYNMEDDGYILSILYNGITRESEMIVFDAKDISVGPISRIPLGFTVPHGLFGCFASETTWSNDEIERRAKLADKVESRGNLWNEVKSDFSGLGLRLDDFEEYFGDVL